MIQLGRRIGEVVVTLLIASFLIFSGMYLAPGDPAAIMAGGPENMTEANLAAIREKYHLDEPFLVQYGLWLGDLMRGDLGRSFIYGDEVIDVIGARLPTTLLLVCYASVLFLTFGILLGALAATKRGLLDSGILVGTMVADAIPGFVAGLALIAVFAVGLGWFPAAGGGKGLIDRIHSLTLPALALAAGPLAHITRVTRQSMLDMLYRDHVEVARSRGIPEGVIIRRHVFWNALGPIATMGGITVASMLAGTVVIETVFGLPGVGALLVNAINNKDFPITQAVLLYMIIGYMVMTTSSDLIHHAIDPRIGERRGR